MHNSCCAGGNSPTPPAAQEVTLTSEALKHSFHVIYGRLCIYNQPILQRVGGGGKLYVYFFKIYFIYILAVLLAWQRQLLQMRNHACTPLQWVVHVCPARVAVSGHLGATAPAAAVPAGVYIQATITHLYAGVLEAAEALPLRGLGAAWEGEAPQTS